MRLKVGKTDMVEGKRNVFITFENKTLKNLRAKI